MPPVVSVVVPCYNQAQFLAPALQSILAQSFSDWEVLLVDDGSTDQTRSVAAEFTDPRIRYLHQENRGLAAARNSGIRAARSEIIALLDSDDVWEPEFLGRMHACLDSNPAAVAAYCGHRYIDSSGETVGTPSPKIVPAECFHLALIGEGNWIVPSAVIFRKSPAEMVGLFDESLKALEDTDLWIRLSAQNSFIGLNETLVKYRLHETNMSKDPERMVSACSQVTCKVFGPFSAGDEAATDAKKRAYGRLYRFGALAYAAHGDMIHAADFYCRLYDLSRPMALGMELWRALARAHMPIHRRNAPFTGQDWRDAEKDLVALLKELEKSHTGQNEMLRIRGSAFLALAEEGVQTNSFALAFAWLSRAANICPALLIWKRYWGTAARATLILMGMRKVRSSSAGDF